MSNDTTKKKRLCHYRWPNCEILRKDINNRSCNSHVWADGIIDSNFRLEIQIR